MMERFTRSGRRVSESSGNGTAAPEAVEQAVDAPEVAAESTSVPVNDAAATDELAPAAHELDSPHHEQVVIDLQRRRDQLNARVAELQWDLGGLVYEMAIRDRIRVDIIVKRAASLQDADAELAEIERILRLEQTATAGACPSCGAPHSSGAAYCWQCGNAILRQVDHSSIMTP